MDRLHTFFRSIYPWIIFLHAALFIAYWLSNRLFTAATNQFLVGLLGGGTDYLGPLQGFAGIIGAWSLARVILPRLGVQLPLPALGAWLYGIFSLLFVVLFYGGFVLLFRNAPVQVVRLGQLVQYTRVVLDPLLLLGAAALIGWGLHAWKPGAWWPLAPGGLVLALLWGLALAWLPGSVLQGELPRKPQIIAHRGASMLAPENTLAAARLAAALGVYGLETDIHISKDGQPFLLHDDTLKRTTNVEALFQGLGKMRAENFTLEEIRRLEAGSWFVTQDPYGTLAGGQVSAAQAAAYRSEKVPTLDEELQIVRDNKLFFIFDLKQPPYGHPYAQSFFDITLRQLKQANIDAQIWFLAADDDLPDLRRSAPAMIPAYGTDYTRPPAADALLQAGYQVVNAEYGLAPEWIARYRQAGLWVNLYTVDEAWQYSRLWLLGVDSTTTSNAGEMVALARPLLLLPYAAYLWLWGAAGLLALGVLAAMYLLLH